MSFRIFLLCLLILLPLTKNPAQNNIRFSHLTIDDGLSQSAVTCMLQDKKGFLWFGTQDGLNRFDGYNFKIFKNDPSDTSTLRDNFIFSIYEDKDGSLYFETEQGNFHKYNPLNESFTLLNKDSINLFGTNYSSVGAMLLETNGIKWTGGLSKNIGLIKEDTKSGKTIQFKHDPSDPSSLSDDKVYSVYRDRKGNLWVGTFNGLDRLDEKTGKFYHYRNDPSDPNSLPDNWVWPIFEDAKGELWIGTVRAGLCRYDAKNNSFYSYKNNPTDRTSINDNFIFSIYQDRSGVIWVGTNTGGLNYFHPSTQAFEHYINKPGVKNSLSNNEVLSLYADKDGIYWIGTRNGLGKFDYSNKKFTNYFSSSSNQNSLLTNTVQVIYQDRDEKMWFGHSNGGLDEYDTKTQRFRHFRHNSLDSNSLSDNRIMALIEDRDGFIWIGTYAGGLNKLDKNTGKITRYQFKENDNTSVSSNYTWSIIEDKEGKLWIGTFGGGINIFDKKYQTFTYLKNDPDNPSSLNDNNIIRIFEDSRGAIWIGTTKGLSRFIKKDNTFKNYREKDGLANDFVYGILEDNEGNLWLSTNNGISRFNPKTETFVNYYYNDGLQNNEFNQNAFAKDPTSGRLLFGGINGFNVFHPDSIVRNKYVPPVVFTEFLRYNTDDEEGKPIIEKGISERDKISLTYKDNIITLGFSALNFNNSHKNQYRYKLEGFNKNWIQLGNDNEVTFTNLSPGEYTLRVIGSNNDGLWNEEGASILINVTPPWWRTNIAYGLYIIAFLSILYGLRKFELNRREQKARVRESELRVKATEAEKKVLEIENERKTKELEEARQLQLSMLPKELPVLPNVEIAAFMRTATEVGGDYYDFIVQEDGTLNVAFGDATGHGLQAGTMVTLMKGFFTSDAARFKLDEFMNHCTFMIKEIKLGRILMSFSFLRINDHRMHITSAGMPPVYYYDKSTGNVEEILIQGMPLGAMRKFSYKIIEKEINSGDTILMLTDGLPEQMNSKEEMYDYSRVKKNFSEIVHEDPKVIIEKLVKSGDEWMNGTPQADDITFVVIKIK